MQLPQAEPHPSSPETLSGGVAALEWVITGRSRQSAGKYIMGEL